MGAEFYQLALTERRRALADIGFVRNDLRIWTHPDGRSIGEGVVTALTDEAFFRFLGIELPVEIFCESERLQISVMTGAL
ncbi:MAG TPA: hypothetical protein PLK30_20075 [Blastocatellia bacterium]|nr:hypothetical protein [Blastocatellia bacterium]